MAKSLVRSWPALALSFALALPAYAAAPYYEGKTARIIVGFSAGGGFDTYSRLIARHLGKPADYQRLVTTIAELAGVVNSSEERGV